MRRPMATRPGFTLWRRAIEPLTIWHAVIETRLHPGPVVDLNLHARDRRAPGGLMGDG